jgi:transposase
MFPRAPSPPASARTALGTFSPTPWKASASWSPWKPPAATSNNPSRCSRPTAWRWPSSTRARYAASLRASAGTKKPNAIDAGLIAWFAQVRPCPPTPPPAPDQQHRRALVTRLRQLTDTGTAQRNQRRLVSDPSVLILIDQLPALIEHQIHALEQQIAALIAQDPLWRALNSEFRSSKGVATRTVARLMAEMPGIGTLSNKSISKLAGLAPLAQDSGRHQGKRRVRGGRPPVRDILFVVASVAGRCEPDLMAFRQRLAAQGKPPKVIRIALAHKLLVRLNAKARDVRRQLEIFPAAEQLSSNPHCST